jgi:hypothetical protein
MPSPSFDREAIEAEIDRVRSFGLDGLRALWCTTFRSSPPPAFTKDLIARFLCRHIQEQALGGPDPAVAKVLGAIARGNKPKADRPRRLKTGTVLLREYQGERHTVTVVANGFVWREATYASLSTIARAITRYEREWTTLLWPPDRQGDHSFAGCSRCAASRAQRATSCPDGRH